MSGPVELARVAVRNVRSYSSAELTLGPGTTLIVGDVGSGKTSLLYAVEMALFGFAEFDASYLVRHGARDAEVELGLSGAGHSYTLHRRFRRREAKGRPTFQLEASSYAEDGVTRRYSATELKQRVIELLGFPDNPNPRAHSDLWRWAVYVPQEAMRQILEQEPSKRLETVRKALGLEQYRIARENAQLVAAELGRRAERHTDQAGELERSAGELDRWSTQLESDARSLAVARDAHPPLRAALEAADAELVRVEALRQQEASRVTERAELSRRLEDADRWIDQHQRRLAQLEERRRELTAAAARAPELERALAELAAEVDEGRRSRDAAAVALEQAQADHLVLAAAETEVRALEHEADQLRSDRERAEADARTSHERALQVASGSEMQRDSPPPGASALDARESLERVRTAESESRGRLAVAEADLAELESLLREGVCPRCHQSVRADEFQSHVADSARAVADRRAEGAGLTSRRTAAEARVREWEAFERRTLEQAQAAALREAARQEASRAEARAGELRGRIDGLEAALSRARARLAGGSNAPERVRQLTETLRALDAEQRARELRRVQLSDERARGAEQLAGQEALVRDTVLLREELERRAAERDRTRARREEVDGIVNATAREVGRLADLRASRQRLSEQRTELDQRIGRLERAVEHARAAREVAQADATRRSRLMGEAAEERKVAEWFLGEFREALAGLEQRLLARAQHEFQAAFDRFFRALVEDPSLFARCDAAFSPGVEIEGEWTPPEALSGGERTALALAYRLALGQVVRNFGQLSLATLVLDEPTDGFSPEQVGRMGELLDELRLPQVVIVSHEAGLASVADRVVRVRKVNGESVIEEGTPLPARATRGGSAAPPASPGAPPRRPRRRTLEEAVP